MVVWCVCNVWWDVTECDVLCGGVAWCDRCDLVWCGVELNDS